MRQDPFTNIYFREVGPGETLSAVHNALKINPRFRYLDNPKYAPSDHGNILTWNISSGDIQVGQEIPIPQAPSESMMDI